MKKALFYIMLFFLFLFLLLFIVPNNMDELWNYGFSYAIRIGEIPYRDFNMVIPPFFPFFMTIPLLLWNNSLSYIIFHCLILLGTIYLVEKMYGDCVYLLLFLFMLLVYVLFPSYNLFLFVLLVCILYLEKSHYRKKDFLIGLLIALSFLTKQNVGIFLVIPTLLFCRKNKLSLSKRFLGFIIPLILFSIYFVVTKSFAPFIDFCFLGLIDFSGNFHSIGIFFFAFLVCFVFSIWILMKNNRIEYWYIILSYMVITPLFDCLHFFYFLPFFFLLLFERYGCFYKWKLVFYVALPTILFGFLIQKQINFSSYPNDIPHMEYRYIPKIGIQYYDHILSYLKDKDFIMYDSSTYFYRIALSDQIGYLDILNQGNMGYHGTQKWIDCIEKNRDKIVLVNHDTERYFKQEENQMDQEIYWYIREHFHLVDSIENFDVYIYNKE